jgi:hypothetical protein
MIEPSFVRALKGRWLREPPYDESSRLTATGASCPGMPSGYEGVDIGGPLGIVDTLMVYMRLGQCSHGNLLIPIRQGEQPAKQARM